MAQRSIAPRGLAVVLALAGLSGCSSFSGMFDSNKIDYRSAAKTPTKTLEVPPDLTQLRRDSRYAVPEIGSSTATASTYNQQNQPAAAPVAAAGAAGVLPKAADMRVERNGNQRYLVVKQSPDLLWPQLKEFWQDSGFLVATENPQTGVMETDWAENRAKLPQDVIRNTVGKLFDFLYATSERDKFRTRLERAADGSTEIYISHRGMVEELTGREKEASIWTPRPADPELEAEFLVRLMARLGSEPGQAKQAVAQAAAAPAAARAKFVNEGGAVSVSVDEDFERAWRRVGLALDRVGFTVEDRDRAVGVYFVRYIDDAATAEGRSFLSRIFFRDDPKAAAQRYRIAVVGKGETASVTVQSEDGKQDNSPTAEKILKLVEGQLK